MKMRPLRSPVCLRWEKFQAAFTVLIGRGGNNLTDCQVFGYRGGRAAAILAKERTLKEVNVPAKENLVSAGKRQRIEAVKAAMDKALMVVRHENTLSDLLEEIELCRRASAPIDTETENFLLVTEVFAESALFRKESRGIHYREDYPDTNPAFEKPTLVQKRDRKSVV